MLQDQGPGPARQVLAENFGPDVVTPPTGDLPAGRFNPGDIRNRDWPDRRSISIRAAPRGDGDALIQDLYRGLQASGAATVTLQEGDPALIQVDRRLAQRTSCANNSLVWRQWCPLSPSGVS